MAGRARVAQVLRGAVDGVGLVGDVGDLAGRVAGVARGVDHDRVPGVAGGPADPDLLGPAAPALFAPE